MDLIYLDPPFNSNASYNVLFKEQSGERSAAQITAFEDTWHWGWESETAFREVVQAGPEKLSRLLQAMREFLGRNDMMAYLVMMAQRMIEFHRVLKPTGSIYLHCDPTASHYLKLLMDASFGKENFRNEIVWKRSSAHSDAKAMGRTHDIILPGFPILGVFRLKGQSKRDGSIIVRSCKASLSPVYPIRDAFLAVNHVFCPSLSSSGPRQWGESALKTSRLPGALSLLAKSWLYPPSAWRRR